MTMTKEKCAFCDKIIANSRCFVRYLSPKRLNIFGLSVTVRKFTSASFRRHSLNLTIDLEIEPRAKLDTMEGLGTSAKK